MFRSPIQPVAALKWLAILLPMAIAVGAASAVFLWSLDSLTQVRFRTPWLIYLLPVAGALIGWMYHRLGKTADGGNNLIIDEIHQPGAGVPRRMAPLIFIGTLATHLFGGSAGREGTAIQMGGSIAAFFGRMLRIDKVSLRLLLMAGVAAGFGAVFGTPIAGTVFALEVLVIGRIQYDALIPCFIAALVAHWTCITLGSSMMDMEHTQFHVAVAAPGNPDVWLFIKAAVAAVAFGLTGGLFATTCHRLEAFFKKRIPSPVLRPAIGGVLVIGLFWLAGTPDYLGLGVLDNGLGTVNLPAMFTSAYIPDGAWLWKFVFTVVTLSAGFKGGEVTPLFFIGAALGNTLAAAMGAPVDLFAAMGMVAIFAAATNTPVASTLLGMELFGAGNGIYLATACIIAYRFSGHSGIYASQRLAIPKFRREYREY